jgi:hypothetical protein
MGTSIGIIGAILTIVVTWYFYVLSRRKSLGLYTLLNTNVFEGIKQDVREDLHFSYRGEKIADLQQLEILFINIGERSIGKLLKPLHMELPAEIQVLDASILYRNPDELEASITHSAVSKEESSAQVFVDFPILNKGEYFVLKLLLSGKPPNSQLLSFSLLSDDMPRIVHVQTLPAMALQEEPRSKIFWNGLIMLFVGIALMAMLYFVRLDHPDWVDFFWNPSGTITFEKILSALISLFGCLIILVGTLSLASSLTSIVLGKPWIVLPKELRSRWQPTPANKTKYK